MKLFYDPVFFASVGLEVGGVENGARSGELEIQEKQLKDGGKEVRYIVHVLNKKDFYTLMHECLHLVKHIFVDRMIPFNAKNDEAIAYYQGFWFKKLWRALNKNRKGK